MDLGLTGRRALVTGASKGIGLAIARSLVREGAAVVAAARRSTAELDELVAARQRALHRRRPLDARGTGELVAAALAGGPVDILVNNVGAVKPRLGGFLSVTDEEWLASLNLSFLAAVRTTRAVLPGMLAAGRRRHRHDGLGQRHAARSARDRLQRGEVGAGELLQVALEGGRAEGDPGQHRQPRPGRDRALARRPRGRGDGRRAQRAATRRRCRRLPRAIRHRVASPSPRRSQTWSCCSRASAQATSSEPTS